MDADVIIVGAGLAGLVAAAEIVEAGRRVIVLDQEPEASLGGQAFWSFGGLFFVDTPEQRRLGIHDSRDLAWQDWQGSAAFDRDDDLWPRRWAEAYVDFAAGEKRGWLRAQGVKIFPVVGWAERGGYLATGHGNSVPRFHLTWGTGPALIEPFVRRVRAAVGRGGCASPRRASGRPTISCVSIGRSASATRRRICSPACPITWMAGCWRSPPRAAPASSTPTACGTTRKASTTTRRSGRATAFASSPAHRRCGSTPAAGARRGRSSPGAVG